VTGEGRLKKVTPKTAAKKTALKKPAPKSNPDWRDDALARVRVFIREAVP